MNVSFDDILIFLNLLMLRHHLVSKNQNLIKNLTIPKILIVFVLTLSKKKVLYKNKALSSSIAIFPSLCFVAKKYSWY